MNVKQCMAEALMVVFRIFPIKKNKIVVDNFNGKGYGDSAKYIVEELLKRNYDYEIIWLVGDRTDCKAFPEKIKKVPMFSVRAFWELATAGFWIDNVRKPCFVLKRRKQFYIQTWHGGVALKRIEKDAEKGLTEAYLRDAKSDSEKVNLMLSNCGFFTNLVRRSFWYEGEILEAGLPRNDIFLRGKADICKKVKEWFAIDEKTNLVLYAPTFRKNKKANNALETDTILRTLREKFGGEWVMLVRFHPNDVEGINGCEETHNVKAASFYPDVQELLKAADVLITDYSATMFEFSMMYKPVFLYVYDYEEYLKDRNFYFSLDKLAYPYAQKQEELIKLINEFDKEKYEKELKMFFEQIELCESGQASGKVAERIEYERKRR